MSERTCSAAGCDRAYGYNGYCRMHAERVRRHGHPGLAGRPRKSMAERLEAKVDSTAGSNACWPWTGKLSKEGYGAIRTGVQGDPTIGAHRAAWLLANPNAEPPETIDHICHDPQECNGGPTCPHRRCCNPAHLVPATVAENSAPDRQWTRRQLTECSRGHAFDEANTYWWTDAEGHTFRHCRACRASWARGRQAAA